MKNEKTVLQEINQFMKELVDVKSARENYARLANLVHDTGMTIKIFSVTVGGGVNCVVVRFSKGKNDFYDMHMEEEFAELIRVRLRKLKAAELI